MQIQKIIATQIFKTQNYDYIIETCSWRTAKKGALRLGYKQRKTKNLQKLRSKELRKYKTSMEEKRQGGD